MFPAPFVGVTINDEPLQLMVAILAVINGFGFTVMVYGKTAPTQVVPLASEAVAL